MSLNDCKKVTITFHEADELPKADVIGKIDAYATVIAAACLSETPVRLATSQVIKKDFHPKWKETFTFNASSKHPLKLQVFDWDRISKDDLVAEVEIPFEECDEKSFDMEVLIRNKKKKEPTITVSVKIEDVDPVGLFALMPALEAAGLETDVVKDNSSGAVDIVANLKPLVHTDVFMSFNFAPSGTKVGVKLLRASPDRSILVRLTRGEQPLDGTLHTFANPTEVAGKSVFEYFVPRADLDVESTDWDQLSVLVETAKLKRQESHKLIAESHGWKPAPPEETPEDRQARLAAIEKGYVQGNGIHYEWHHNKQEPNPVKALAGYTGGVAHTKIVSDKSHKYLGDVTISGKDNTRTITLHSNPDTSVGGITVGTTTSIKSHAPPQAIIHSLYRLKSFEAGEGAEEKKVHPVPVTSFAKLK